MLCALVNEQVSVIRKHRDEHRAVAQVLAPHLCACDETKNIATAIDFFDHFGFGRLGFGALPC